jgi:glycosyltransferase involved in cell wall biosynthesis
MLFVDYSSFGVPAAHSQLSAAGPISTTELRMINSDEINKASGERGRQRATKLVKVLVVGQVPPPVNGQSLMISAFLEGEYKNLELHHVAMRFSRSTSEIGVFNARKLLLLFATLAEIIVTRFRSGATVLYYPPAGANLTPVIRDCVLLIPTRLLFRATIFHFHAAGLSNIYSRLSLPLRWLYRRAYNEPDLAIFTTVATSTEAEHLNAKRIAIVPCGIADHTLSVSMRKHRPDQITELLFVGILCEEKGVLVLLDACKRLLAEGVLFNLKCLGAFQSAAFKQKVESTLLETGLSRHVSFPGVVTGSRKVEIFSSADIFCFPSYYPAESFGVVLIEAMSFHLPIISTNWQGIPEVVGSIDGAGSGGAILVPPKDSSAFAEALLYLLQTPSLREKMAAYNRSRFLERFTLDRYRDNLAIAVAEMG